MAKADSAQLEKYRGKCNYFVTFNDNKNGKKLDEPYVSLAVLAENNVYLGEQANYYNSASYLALYEQYKEKTAVPEGMIFVLGDHRNYSYDSRYFGMVDERLVLGRVLLRISPFDRFGVVD